MEKKYKKIEFYAGESIEKAVTELLEHNERGELACGSFNGHMLYSDNVTVDGAYLEIFGKTKAEFEKGKEEWLKNRNRERKEYESKIPELAKEWTSKGHEILEEKYWNEWDKGVLTYLGGLYEGILQECLDIVEALNNGCTLAEAKEILEKQEHSGMSMELVKEMIKSFCDRGQEFADNLI